MQELNDSHEGHGEMEPLPQASEGDEGLSGETACGHLAVGLLVLPHWALAHEPTGEAVHALAAVLAHAWYTPAGRGVHLAVLTCRRRRSRGCFLSVLWNLQHISARIWDEALLISQVCTLICWMKSSQQLNLLFYLFSEGVLIHGGLKYSSARSISCSGSSCLTKIPLIIGHADIQWPKMYVLRPCIKH